MQHRHGEEAMALYAHALKLGLDNDLPTATIRAHFNLADLLCHRDRYVEALEHYRSAPRPVEEDRRQIVSSAARSPSLPSISHASANGMRPSNPPQPSPKTRCAARPRTPLSLFGLARSTSTAVRLRSSRSCLSWTAHLASSDDWQARTHSPRGSRVPTPCAGQRRRGARGRRGGDQDRCPARWNRASERQARDFGCV